MQLTNNKIDHGPMPPMSSENVEITQTMLQTGMMDAPAMPGPIGAIDRFEVIKLLGQGGMGQVMLAREPITDASVAIKIINPMFAKEQWAVRRFLTEAQHMYRMSHPNILKVLEVSDRKAGPYYVMPYIEGGSLAERIKPGQPLSKEEIMPIARQIADALKYAHSRGIIHRDLKPANILIDAAGRAYLTDFGLLRTVFNDSIIDVSKRSVEGTPAYLSPSAAEGKADDTRCDIYAFGAVLYEMLTGLKPYDGSDPESIIKKIIAGPPRPIREINPEAPADLVQIAENCMARELRDRYAEMADVLRDLERLFTGETILGSHGTAPQPQAQNRIIRRLRLKRTLSYIAGGCLIIGACSACIGGKGGLGGLISGAAALSFVAAISIDRKIEQLLRSPKTLDQAQNRTIRRLRLKSSLWNIVGVCTSIAAIGAYIGGEAGLCGLLAGIAGLSFAAAISIDLKNFEHLFHPQKSVTKFRKYIEVGRGIIALLLLLGLINIFEFKSLTQLWHWLQQPAGLVEHAKLPLITETSPRGSDKDVLSSGNKVKIVSISPEISKPLSAGQNYDIEVTVEYTIKAENGNITLVIQRGDSITSVLANTTEPITKGSGKITLKANIVVPSVNSITVFTPLSLQGETSTTVVDTRIYKVIGN